LEFAGGVEFVKGDFVARAIPVIADCENLATISSAAETATVCRTGLVQDSGAAFCFAVAVLGTCFRLVEEKGCLSGDEEILVCATLLAVLGRQVDSVFARGVMLARE
jgi:hypothetical protein